MAILNIQTGVNNPILRKKSVEVGKIDKKLHKLLDSMRETMLSSDGAGIAAPQVGHNIRVIVCAFNQGTKNELIMEMINPVITSFSERKAVDEEGCLSVPGKFGPVERSTSITVRFKDRKGRELALKLEDMNARIVQHEVDHIEGILFVDKLVSAVVNI